MPLQMHTSGKSLFRRSVQTSDVRSGIFRARFFNDDPIADIADGDQSTKDGGCTVVTLQTQWDVCTNTHGHC